MNGAPASLYGLVGEFRAPEEAVALAHRLKEDGFRRFDVYSPMPIDEMEGLIPRRPTTELALIMFAAAMFGAAIGFFMQYAVAVIAYPINVGGRPLDSWPAFVPIAWEICAWLVVYTGFAAFLIFCRLPMLYHPIFATPGFERATQDRVFVCVEATDPCFDQAALAHIFLQYSAIHVAEVPK